MSPLSALPPLADVNWVVTPMSNVANTGLWSLEHIRSVQPGQQQPHAKTSMKRSDTF